jgi:hypothetical protein
MLSGSFAGQWIYPKVPTETYSVGSSVPKPVQQKADVKKKITFDKDSLTKVLRKEHIEKFCKIEDRLIEEMYFDENGKWVKSLDECAALINRMIRREFCTYAAYKKNGAENWITKVLKPFFEERYKIKFTSQMQRGYRNHAKLDGYLLFINSYFADL